MKSVYLTPLVLMLVAMCNGKTSFSCDAGPPGRYCFDDLTGYHDCHVDAKTGKMVDTPHACKNGTRCSCFVGPSCPDSAPDPCSKYRSAPDFPNKFSVYGETKTQVIGPQGPSPVRARQIQVFQNLDESKARRNKNNQNFHESWFYLPHVQENSYNLFYVRWDKDFCNKTTTASIPRFGVPTYFTCNGTEKLDWRVCEEWVWQNGGRHAGDPRTVERWLIWQDPSDHHYEPVRYEYRYYGTPMSKTNVVANTTYVYLPDVLDSEFDPPKQYCSVSAFDII